ncbi:YcaO-like family protein [Actinoplanes sp. NPDC026670]|uniref:YcaO-like family protein n=1 Tax=Actinoplanes sp. NPDC026670 TaxID=3154700 RepID=UPI0033DA9170
MPTTVNDHPTRPGSFRAATAEQTWERIRPMLPRFGITRVADITWLDEVGLPVHVAYRPTGRCLAVTVGTGLTMAQSRVAATMESIEGWHAENPRHAVAVRAPAVDLDLGFDPRSLHLAPRSPLTGRTVLDWIAGRGLLTGRTYLAPYDLVYLDFTVTPGGIPNDVLFTPTSSGLATGNTAAEATLHALLELVERDGMTPYAISALADRRYVDPDSCADPSTMAVLAAVRGSSSWVELVDLTGPTGLPCYGASMWDNSIPMVFGGFGCHVDPGRAAGRALAEAAQSRLVTVGGARDDISGEVYMAADPYAEPPPALDLPCEPIRPPDPAVTALGQDLEALVQHVAGRIMEYTGHEPFVVDLTHDDVGIPVSRVIAPGLRLVDDAALSLRPGAGDV